jgi:hypothetical protein
MTLARLIVGAPSLADSIARIDPLQDRTRLRFGPQDGWITCAEMLADQTELAHWIDRAGISLLNDYGHGPRRTAAAYVMAWYLSVPAFVAGMLFHHERRVPSLRPHHLGFRLGVPRPEPVGTSLLSSRFTCLPDDPAAGTADVDVVADERTLAAVLRGRFAAHATRFVTTFGPIGRIDRRTLWGAATDALDNALLLAGRGHGDEEAGVMDATLVLPTVFPPFTTASTVRPNATGTAWIRRKESCCYHYLLPAGQGSCDSCPRVLPKQFEK